MSETFEAAVCLQPPATCFTQAPVAVIHFLDTELICSWILSFSVSFYTDDIYFQVFYIKANPLRVYIYI